MRFISLFAGVGGFDLGFERAGHECVLQVEKDQHCLEVLRRRWPNVPKMEDVRDVTKQSAPDVDMVIGGFPCQDVSLAGTRKGLDGGRSRSGLWFEFHRILRELRPRIAVIENVPGLFSSNGGRDFATILRGLSEQRYLSAWRVLDAQYFGVPQRRRRVFFVASLGDGACAEILFERESVRRDTAKSRKTRPGATGGSPAGTGGDISYNGDRQEHRVRGVNGPAATLGAGINSVGWYSTGAAGESQGRPGGADTEYNAYSAADRIRGTEGVASTLSGPTYSMNWQSGQDGLHPQEGRTDPVVSNQTIAVYSTPSTEGSGTVNSDGSGNMITGAIPIDMQNASHLSDGIAEPNRKGSGIGTEGDPMYTLTSNDRHAVSATDTAKWAKQAGGPAGAASENNNCVIHQIAPTLSTKNEVASSSTQREKWQEQSAELFGAVRRLTPVECCRLQGFPDDWNDDQTDSQRYRQMGNAVCVPVAEWIGRRIAEYGDGPKDG